MVRSGSQRRGSGKKYSYQNSRQVGAGSLPPPPAPIPITVETNTYWDVIRCRIDFVAVILCRKSSMLLILLLRRLRQVRGNYHSLATCHFWGSFLMKHYSNGRRIMAPLFLYNSEATRPYIDDFGYRGFVEGNIATATLPPLLALTYPQVQEKAAEEIHATLGTNFPRYNDRVSLPYCEALLLETLRKTTIIPLSIPHSALEDTEFQGFFINKDTMVIGNLYAAHNDPKVWTDPGSFRPERFLNNNGKLNNMEAFVMSFSTGKRKCIGEKLARNQLFLFAVRVYRR
ncbi:unnamed protein product [Allacma fusca]|uniref:Cytochrome P450 n=1 Tax=Allacma fusca TaxID=39272 RepID=A0A8J2J6I8_9HEXA|nr:unnamed protein product [Allacma fusca]